MGIGEIYKRCIYFGFLVKKYVLTSNVGVNLQHTLLVSGKRKMHKPEHRVYGCFPFTIVSIPSLPLRQKVNFPLLNNANYVFFLMRPTLNRVRTDWGRSKCRLCTTECVPFFYSCGTQQTLWPTVATRVQRLSLKAESISWHRPGTRSGDVMTN